MEIMYPSASSLLLTSKLVFSCLKTKQKKLLSNDKHMFILFMLLEGDLFGYRLDLM